MIEVRIPILGRQHNMLTRGFYYPATNSVEITSGPLTGRKFSSPTAAAWAVLRNRNSHRNGWTFWQVAPGPLHQIRLTSRMASH